MIYLGGSVMCKSGRPFEDDPELRESTEAILVQAYFKRTLWFGKYTVH